MKKRFRKYFYLLVVFNVNVAVAIFCLLVAIVVTGDVKMLMLGDTEIKFTFKSCFAVLSCHLGFLNVIIGFKLI